MESNTLSRAEIKYARNGGVALAFQVVGEGDVDLVYVPDYVSNLAYGWEYPPWRDFPIYLSTSGGNFSTRRRSFSTRCPGPTWRSST